MLVLSRKQGESILIAGDIRITILRTNGRTIRLGIEAPDSVAIRRTELDIRNDDQEPRPSRMQRREIVIGDSQRSAPLTG